jgi:hypothetical protein
MTQLLPPSVVWMMVPLSPVALPVFASMNDTAYSVLPWGRGFCQTQRVWPLLKLFKSLSRCPNARGIRQVPRGSSAKSKRARREFGPTIRICGDVATALRRGDVRGNAGRPPRHSEAATSGKPVLVIVSHLVLVAPWVLSRLLA